MKLNVKTKPPAELAAPPCSAGCRCLRCMRREMDGLNTCHQRAVGNCAIEAGKALRRRRQLAGISMREAAAHAGVTKMFLCDVELGRRFPNHAMVEKLMLATQNVPALAQSGGEKTKPKEKTNE